MPSVESALKAVLPQGTTIAAGRRGLGREVTWALCMRTRAPVFPELHGGELALLSTEALQSLDADLPQLLASLLDRGVAAAAILGEVDEKSVSLAEDHHLPLLLLPKGTNLQETATTVTNWAVEERDRLYQSGTDIYRRLTELSIADRGMAAILETLSGLTGVAFILEDQDFQVRLTHSPPGSDKRADVNDNKARDQIRRYVESGPLAASDPPTFLIAAGNGRGRIVAPVVARGAVVGYLSALGNEPELGEIIRLAVARGAAACALEMAKERAVVEAETRLRGDFVEELLNSSFPSDDVALNRARHLGYDLSRPQAVIVFAQDPSKVAKPQRRDKRQPLTFGEVVSRAFSGREQPYLLWAAADAVAVLCTVQDPADLAAIKAEAEKLRLKVLARRAEPTVSAATGQYYAGVRGLSTTYQEAKRALAIAQSLFGGNRTICFRELGVYRLLFSLHDNPEVKSLYQEALGRLLEHDKKSRMELVKTLETYFTCQENLQRTAEALYLHRNSLVYRMKRIRELTGFHLDDVEQRFLLQLALKIKRVLG